MASKLFSLIVALPLLLLAAIYSSNEVAWVVIQSSRAVFGPNFFPDAVNSLEQHVWNSWEKDALNRTYDHDTMLLPIPVITSDDQIKNIDFTKPFLVRNYSSGVVLQEKDWLEPPLRDITIEYYSDARKVGLWSPDEEGKLGDVAKSIFDGGHAKFLTQKIVEGYPELVDQFIEKNTWVTKVFGEKRVKGWVNRDTFVRVPMFMAKGRDVDDLKDAIRTDCHAEPASNLALQTMGKKRWTLVEPRYSYLIRPRISVSSTPYCIAQISMVDKKSFWHVPRYEIVTEEGDALYLPAWTWHRVEYLPNIVSSHLSFFEMVRDEFLGNSPMMSLGVIPLLVKRAAKIALNIPLDL